LFGGAGAVAVIAAEIHRADCLPNRVQAPSFRPSFAGPVIRQATALAMQL